MTQIPWWRSGRRTAVVAGLAAAAGTVLAVIRFTDRDVHDGLSLLMVLPIAAFALMRGRRAGVLAGAAALAFLTGWGVADHVELGPATWTALAVPPTLTGIVGGMAGDALVAAARWRRVACEAHRQEQRTTQRVESVVQALVAAKWAFEAGRGDSGVAGLTEAIDDAEQLVVDLVRHPASGAGRPSAATPAAVDLTNRPGPPSIARVAPPL